MIFFRYYPDSIKASLVKLMFTFVVGLPYFEINMIILDKKRYVEAGIVGVIGIIIWYYIARFCDKMAIEDIQKKEQKRKEEKEIASREIDIESYTQFNPSLSYGRFETPARIIIHRKNAFFGILVKIEYDLVSIESDDRINIKLKNKEKFECEVYYADNVVINDKYLIQDKFHVSPGENVTLVYAGAELKEVIRV